MIGTFVLIIGLLALCIAGLVVWVWGTIDAIKKREPIWIAFSIFSWLVLGIVLYTVGSVIV